MSQPFHVTRREPLLDSVVFRVERRYVTGEDVAFDRDIVVHQGAVAVLPIRDDGFLGFLRQYRASFDRVLWEIPAGTRDVNGEEPLATAQRELSEEMGLIAHQWEFVCEYMNSAGWTSQTTVLYTARDFASSQREPDGPEESTAEIVWLSPNDARALLRGPEVLESSTYLALLWHLGTHSSE